jgi:polysaccharide export outer membrane protein
MKMRPIVYFLLGSFILGTSNGQLDPRISSALGGLSPQQIQMLKQKAGMLNQRTELSDEDTLENKEKKGLNELPKDTQQAQDSSDKEEVNVLQELIFLEHLLLNDLQVLEEEEMDPVEEDQLSANEKLRRIESLEQIKRLMFEIKQKQRDEIEKHSNEIVKIKEQLPLPFGHEFFAGLEEIDLDQMSFIPADYKVGPGDVLEILLFGQRNESFNLLINRDGIIQFPNIGPISVFEQGRDFVSLKNAINRKIKEFLGEGVQSSISLGSLRSIPIFVLGQVNRPGHYMIPPYASITTALRLAGGISEKGSMRDVTLKRKGSVVGKMDLYDLFLRGDASADEVLLAGDVVFVSALGEQVVVTGEVQHPALYELIKTVSLAELLKMSGGISSRGHPKLIKLERRNEFGRYDLIDLDISADKDFMIHGGDIVKVPKAEARFVQAVELVGPVERAGFYQWKKGLSLKKLFNESGVFLDHADMKFGYLVRQDSFRNLTIKKFYPRSVLLNQSNLDLLPEDRIIILSNQSLANRFADIRRVLIELRKQTHNATKTKIVSVLGEVHFAGDYLLAEQMTVHDLVLAAGGLNDNAFSVGAELTRSTLDDDSTSQINHIRIKPAEYLESNNSVDFYLQPYDTLSIKPIPSWSSGQSVELKGEFKFPGTYKINKGETLKEVIARAGGLTKAAFVPGTFFSRKALFEREEKEKERMILQLESDLGSASLDALNAAEVERSQTAAKSLLSKLKATESTGRLVIDLEKLLQQKSNDFYLKDGDVIDIPDRPSSVSVLGEVLFPSSHLHLEDLSREDYLQKSGGFTANADKDRIFVVKANGSVISDAQNKWFGASGNDGGKMEAGDVIIVPIDVQKSRFLEQLSYSSQIIYQMAVAAAAVNSF